MSAEKSVRRMPLRQMIIHTEKSVRELHDLLYFTMLTDLSDFRDLSRPVRRKSHYPTLITIQNGLRKLQQAHEKADALCQEIQECLETIRDHANRERINRL